MNSYDFVHLSLHAMGGEIRGKTKLQKTIYFLGVLTGRLDELGFRAHYYGPYSSEVAGAVDRLLGLGFLDSSTASGGAIDRFGFEVARYDFRLNEAGQRTAESKASKYSKEWNSLQIAAGVLKSASEQDYIRLSIAAKTLFMLGGKTATSDQLASVAEKFGWSVTAQQISNAAEYLKKLGLVEIE
ncbi:MAG: hypothetical protein WD872_05995 [Pirellulaceae bacterium]